MHKTYGHVHGVPYCGKPPLNVFNIFLFARQMYHHHHNEVARQHGLTDVFDIDIPFHKESRNFGNNTDFVAADNRNNCVYC